MKAVSVTILLALCAPALAKEFSDADFCAAMKQKSIALKADRPRWDGDERLDAIHPDCDAKTVEFNWSLKQSAADQSHGWEDRLQHEWDSRYCSDADVAPALAQGWTVKVTLALADGSTLPLSVYCGR